MEAYHEDAHHCPSLGYSHRVPGFHPIRDRGTTHQNLQRQSAQRTFGCLPRLPVDVVLLVVKLERCGGAPRIVSCLISITKEIENARCLDVFPRRRRCAHFSSGTMSQDARARANALEENAANGVVPFAEYSAQPRIIWRSSEIRPLIWEEQRVFDRSSQPLSSTLMR